MNSPSWMILPDSPDEVVPPCVRTGCGDATWSYEPGGAGPAVCPGRRRRSQDVDQEHRSHMIQHVRSGPNADAKAAGN